MSKQERCLITDKFDKNEKQDKKRPQTHLEPESPCCEKTHTIIFHQQEMDQPDLKIRAWTPFLIYYYLFIYLHLHIDL